MGVIKTIIFGFILVFIVLVVFMLSNTYIIGEIVPIFDDMAVDFFNNDTPWSYSDYEERRDANVSTFYIAIAIIIITVFLFVVVNLLFKREPTATQGGVYYQ